MRKVFPGNDVLYIPIGQAPISCLLLMDDFLWCASGNTVNIIQARYFIYVILMTFILKSTLSD